jgi:phospholipid/cholesterol/gamma-HCH transport system substrate-binding protein
MERDPASSAVPRDLRFRVGMLIGVTLILLAGFVAYVLYARGVFEDTQKLILVADNAEGVSLGMDLSFSGFPIGRVNRMTLGEDGRASIEILVPRKDARWLRRGSIFTLERGLVGGARIRAYTGDLEDAPLEDGAVRPVLRGDASEEIPRMVASLRSMLENVERITADEGSLQAGLDNFRTLTERLGSEENARKIAAAIDRANALLAGLGRSAQKLDGMLDRTERRLFDEGGIADDATRAMRQASAMLTEVRESLRRLDGILGDAQAASANARTVTESAKAATTDLAALRAEVDATVRRVGSLIEEINRKWPFQRDTEIRLP